MPEQRVAKRIGARTLSLSNLDKVLWPRDGYTKGDLVEYYESVAPYAVAHLAGRPLTLQRYPNGIEGQTFFEKQMPRGMPDWIERVTLPTPGGSPVAVTFATSNDAARLVYFANIAEIVLHVWTSRLPAIEEPDFVIFDLDPGETCASKSRKLATVALGVRGLLEAIGLDAARKDDRQLWPARRRAPLASRVFVRHREDICGDRRAARRRGTSRTRNAAAHDRQASASGGLRRLRAGRSRQDDRRALFGARAGWGAGLDAAALGGGRSPRAAAYAGRSSRRVREAYDRDHARTPRARRRPLGPKVLEKAAPGTRNSPGAALVVGGAPWVE